MIRDARDASSFVAPSSHRFTQRRHSANALRARWPDTIGSVTVARGNVRRYLLMQGLDYISYETFGRRFFEVAVTEERVGAAFAAIAGSQFDMPPMAQGPGKIAKVSANVTIKQPQVTRNVDDSITFDIHIPLLIDLLVDLRIDKQRFT